MAFFSLRDLNRPRGPFDECVEFQKQSQELVIFSPTAGQVVRIAWPMSKKKRIVPKGIKDWLRSRGLHWACFCALIADHGSSTSTQIVQSMGDGKVHVFCSSYPPECHFYLTVNLDNIYETSSLESEYSHIPTLPSTTMFSMSDLLADFLLRETDTSEFGPYFKGYCGEHVREHPSITQLSGSEVVVRKTRPHPYSLAGRLNKRSRVISGHASSPSTRVFSRTSPEPTPMAGSSTGPGTANHAITLLRQLEAGHGITEQQYEDLLEKCDGCHRYYLAHALKVHIPTCGGIIEIL